MLRKTCLFTTNAQVLKKAKKVHLSSLVSPMRATAKLNGGRFHNRIENKSRFQTTIA